MAQTHHSFDDVARGLPRRLRMSSREIGVATALTVAAATQLMASMLIREDRASVGDRADIHPAALIRQAR